MNTTYWQDKLFNTIAAHRGIVLEDPLSKTKTDGYIAQEFLDLCMSWGTYFTLLKLQRNTPIILPMRNGIDSVAIFFGALNAQLFPILVKPVTPAHMVADMIERIGGGLFVSLPALVDTYKAKKFRPCGPDYAGYSVLIAPGEPRVHPDVEGGCILGVLSSGTTGRPKVIVHTLKNVMRNARMHADSIGLATSDTVALSLPLSFSSGLVAGLFGTLLSGAKGLLVDSNRINPRKLLSNHPVSVCMGTPGSILATFGEHALKDLRKLTVGGDVLHPQLAVQLMEQFMVSGQVYATYGLSEAGPRVATALLTPELVRQYDAVPLGKPLDGVRLSIEDNSGYGETGELVVETPTAMHGYLYDECSSKQVMSKPFGVVHTGDIFRQVSGQYIFSGRKKRIIVRGGENIYPSFIESKILNLFNFDDVWVTSEPHHELGEVPKAFLLSDQEIDLKKLAKELRRHLPNSHIPAVWEVVQSLPVGARK